MVLGKSEREPLKICGNSQALLGKFAVKQMRCQIKKGNKRYWCVECRNHSNSPTLVCSDSNEHHVTITNKLNEKVIRLWSHSRENLIYFLNPAFRVSNNLCSDCTC